MIVADTTAIGALCIAGPLSQHADACFRRDPVWAAPRLWRDEFLNVLATSVRLGAFDLSTAASAWGAAIVRLAPHEQYPDPIRTLSLATTHRIAASDAQFVATAQALGTKLLTEDKDLLRKFPGLAVSLKTFASSA